MKLHYKGTYDLNPDSLPHGEHQPNAHPFKEAENSKKMSIIANVGGTLIMLALLLAAVLRSGEYRSSLQFYFGCLASFLALFPHELLHAVCFREDVYLYTNWKQGMLFVIGPETMSRRRFVFLSLLPNIVFGFLPFIIGMIFPRLFFFACFGALCTGMGFGDYYNVFNALTQMPKGAKTYLYGFHSYWYLPEDSGQSASAQNAE